MVESIPLEEGRTASARDTGYLPFSGIDCTSSSTSIIVEYTKYASLRYQAHHCHQGCDYAKR